jgi:transposase
VRSISRSRNQHTACRSRPPSRQSSETEHLRRGRLFLPALRHDRITAPCVIDGPINGGSFRADVEQFLVPTLSSGDVVVMDNLGSHKGKGVRSLIRAAGAKLFFLPRYAPDLNLIEQVFAKLKTLWHITDPRTIETTWRGIDLLDRFTPQECANYLANAGYASA